MILQNANSIRIVHRPDVNLFIKSARKFHMEKPLGVWIQDCKLKNYLLLQGYVLTDMEDTVAVNVRENVIRIKVSSTRKYQMSIIIVLSYLQSLPQLWIKTLRGTNQLWINLYKNALLTGHV